MQVAIGQLEIHGAPRRRTWTKLNGSIPVGSTLVTTLEAVDFQPGDSVFLTSNSWSYGATETATVATVINATAFTVTKGVRYDHTSTSFAGGQYNHANVELRSEVGLLSRNVVIQGDDSSDSQLFGVHTAAMHGKASW